MNLGTGADRAMILVEHRSLFLAAWIYCNQFWYIAVYQLVNFLVILEHFPLNP